MSRSNTLVAVLGLFAVGCGGSTTAPSSSSSSASNTAVFTAQVLPANEVPPVANAESTGSGTVTITFTLTRDAAGTVTAATAAFNGTFTGFPAGTALTAAHIHPGAAGTNGGALISATISAGEVTFPAGSGTMNKTGITVPADQATSVLANPAGFYFNIHTALNPGGVARGQLTRTQ